MVGEPSRRSRSRSRSPGRRARPSRGGFRWKDNRRRDDGREDSGHRRDFRDRSRERERERDGHQKRDRNDGRGRYRDGTTGNRDGGRDRDGPARGSDRLRSPRRDSRDSRDSRVKDDARRENKSKSRPAAAAAAPAAGAGEEMIIVNVNDRLGSKSAVPCLPSDTVGQFKIMVAARIGREPSQIMLKRQGERPFKDHITLEDYGISNGVQLDLEIDTGD
ncbi:hypothetical protein E4U55_000141 [Claviceps digitariae]|nr:hypothetical protein E4U55_000141 [Claviceps digitariae]